MTAAAGPLADVAAHAHGPVPQTLLRDFADIDVVMSGRDAKAAGAELVALGYTPNDRFNALHGAKRMLFYDVTNGRQLDVFIGDTDSVPGVAISPNDRLVLTSSKDGTVRLWKTGVLS